MNILFTCVGRRHYLLKYFKENMSADDKIIGTDMQITSPAIQIADEKIIVPPVYDPQYISILLDICKKYDISAIISLNDLELPILSDNKYLFEQI